ncbi:hypothetical protein GCM10011348_00590 [Marinobacterium nitratireducens]|uniref:Uncharacterized protein n=1 Tax=Marinobacterium nitratireducens TaxID=518897 RepID=A0A918DMR7_9GAMM|nr:EAL domain-containing protein [Marinobacterium nitratireducens]GGO75546.1 hypothetical protein GCM10011348_00590 [Marinobacterium nitratireducens]
MLRKTSLISVTVFFLVLLLGTYWSHLNHRLLVKEQEALLRDVINTQATAIERLLNETLLSTQMMAHEVRRYGGEPRDFPRRAEEILRDFPAVSSLQLVPSGVIRRIYPLAGNEAAIGLHLFKHPLASGPALRARRDAVLTLNGPLELVQGGIGVVGYNPVFLRTGDGGEVFWGFVSAVIDLERLLSVTDLGALAANGYFYELLRPDGKAVDHLVAAGGRQDRPDTVQSLDVPVPNGRWILRMGRDSEDGTAGFRLGVLMSFAVGLLIAWLVHYVLREPQRLRMLVDSRTQELHRLAYHDFLTGLVNRRLLQEELEQSLREQARSGEPLALLYLDLDDFKRINDSMGHEVGDQLLIAVARRLRGQVRANDIVARLGGDEFAVVLQGSGSSDDLLRLAEKLINAIRQPVQLHNRELVISTSIGITVAPVDGDSASQLSRNADLALYASKRRGKNCIAFFDPAMQQEASRLMQLEEELRAALGRRELVLAYQPIVELSQQRTVAYEALIRWHHPRHGWLAPSEFIPAAEQSGLIVALGYRVLETVCEMLAAAVAEGCERVPVAVNISPQQFRDKRFLQEVERILAQTGAPPGLLELEITETSLMDNLESTAAILDELQRIGLRISIDDFGTGYSSLALLKQLPVDTLKIDRCFVRDLEVDEGDRQIIQAVVAMAAKLHLDVVAEGVESDAQRQWLLAFGCRCGQGYLFGRPQIVERPFSGAVTA